MSIENVFAAVWMTKAIIQALHLSPNGMHCNLVALASRFLKDSIYVRMLAILGQDCTKKQTEKTEGMKWKGFFNRYILLLSLLMICSVMALFLDLELSEFHYQCIHIASFFLNSVLTAVMDQLCRMTYQDKE